MKTEVIAANGIQIAVVRSDELLITDVPSALDLAMSVQHETGCNRIALQKEAITKDFFQLSTCLAGEILQKYINYHVKLAVFGCFSGYTSKPLHDFIYESNHGNDVFFVATQEEAVAKLAAAK